MTRPIAALASLLILLSLTRCGDDSQTASGPTAVPDPSTDPGDMEPSDMEPSDPDPDPAPEVEPTEAPPTEAPPEPDTTASADDEAAGANPEEVPTEPGSASEEVTDDVTTAVEPESVSVTELVPEVVPPSFSPPPLVRPNRIQRMPGVPIGVDGVPFVRHSFHRDRFVIGLPPGDGSFSGRQVEDEGTPHARYHYATSFRGWTFTVDYSVYPREAPELQALDLNGRRDAFLRAIGARASTRSPVQVGERIRLPGLTARYASGPGFGDLTVFRVRETLFSLSASSREGHTPNGLVFRHFIDSFDVPSMSSRR